MNVENGRTDGGEREGGGVESDAGVVAAVVVVVADVGEMRPLRQPPG